MLGNAGRCRPVPGHRSLAGVATRRRVRYAARGGGGGFGGLGGGGFGGRGGSIRSCVILGTGASGRFSLRLANETG
jgi:hypothetical protein